MASERRVRLFVAGVQKCGTSTLFNYLSAHPGLSPPDIKETHFFDDESHDWSTPDYRSLHALFRSDDDDLLRFECTPITIFWPPSLARIHAYNPAARLILLFRDPVDRAWSGWCMEYARGNENLVFAKAIREGRCRMEGLPELAFERRIYTYIERGRYARQLRRALELFPREQILLLTLDELAGDHTATLARIAEFLDIASFPHISARRDNARPEHTWPALPTAEDRELITAELSDDIAEFTEMTGITFF